MTCSLRNDTVLATNHVADHFINFASVIAFAVPHLAILRLQLYVFFPNPVSLPSPHRATTMAEIKIDKNLFQERLSHFISAWKADKRSGDALFGGASSILILMGKTEETAQFQKNNAMHVWKLLYAMRSLADTDFMIVLVAWLRISGYAVLVYNGGTLRGDNCEEG
jgi:hypothetical protein